MDPKKRALRFKHKKMREATKKTFSEDANEQGNSSSTIKKKIVEKALQNKNNTRKRKIPEAPTHVPVEKRKGWNKLDEKDKGYWKKAEKRYLREQKEQTKRTLAENTPEKIAARKRKLFAKKG